MPIRIIDRNSSQAEAEELRFLLEMDASLRKIAELSVEIASHCTLASVTAVSAGIDMQDAQSHEDLLAIGQKILEMSTATNEACASITKAVFLLKSASDLLRRKFPDFFS